MLSIFRRVPPVDGKVETPDSADESETHTEEIYIEADMVASAAALETWTVAPILPLPDYVAHQDGVPRVGALSAEAMVRDYEAAAHEIESMGAELVSAAEKCEAMTAEVHHAIAYMHETAATYREQAKYLVRRIEECTLFTQDVLNACETIKRRIEANSLVKEV